jgi:threonine/homoserine/homoserine lactone efflux protein
MLLSRQQSQDEVKPEIKSKSSWKLYSQGLITQLSNPKAILFFSALLPQFITPGQSMAYQVLILGIVSVSVEFPVLVTYGWLAERGSRLIPQKYSSIPDRVAGGFLISAGIGLALKK